MDIQQHVVGPKSVGNEWLYFQQYNHIKKALVWFFLLIWLGWMTRQGYFLLVGADSLLLYIFPQCLENIKPMPLNQTPNSIQSNPIQCNGVRVLPLLYLSVPNLCATHNNFLSTTYLLYLVFPLVIICCTTSQWCKDKSLLGDYQGVREGVRGIQSNLCQ